MIENTVFAWAALLLLGAVHGVNPGMGWLFAVALGMQERDGRAVWRSLLPLAAGHALAVAAAVAVLMLVGRAIPLATLRWFVAALLLVMGLLHLRHRFHPRRGGMRVGARDLVVWSFLMASAHGAGVMALAFVPADAVAQPTATTVRGMSPDAHTSHTSHVAHASVGGDGAGRGRLIGLLATLVHTAGYLLATGLIATTVYYRFGLRLLQRAWINLDLIWAGALIVTAVLIPFLG